jgi:hypothetical protein
MATHSKRQSTPQSMPCWIIGLVNTFVTALLTEHVNQSSDNYSDDLEIPQHEN